MSNIVPIVMASNDKYVPYLGVAIHSLIKHASDDNSYVVYVIESEMNDFHKRKLRRMQNDTVQIEFLNVKKLMDNIRIPTVNHLSAETAYRFFIDRLLPQYDKVLYLDCDIVILRDVAELYALELGNNSIGAVRGRIFKASEKYIVDELGMSIEGYFNAGILLINVARFQSEKIGEQGIKMLSEKIYGTQDQDVLNLLCRGEVKYLDYRWNVEWEHLTGASGEPVIDEARRDSLDAMSDPYIIHYTSGIKPWMRPDIELADYFWREARETEFYEEILFQNLEPISPFSPYSFPWDAVEPHSKVVLYGFGRVGHFYVEQIKKSSYCKLVAICDKRAEGIRVDNVFSVLPQDIMQHEFDYILIAIEQEKTAEIIKKDLLGFGVDPSKIKWKDPLCR